MAARKPTATVNIEGIGNPQADVYVNGKKYALVDPSGLAEGDPRGRVLDLTATGGAVIGSVTVGPGMVDEIKTLLRFR